MRRALAAGLALVLLALPLRGVQGQQRVHVAYLPLVAQRLPEPAPLCPATAEELVAALAVPGARVHPAPGTYRLPRPAPVAPGVTLDGRGEVRLVEHGLVVKDADGVRLLRLSIAGTAGDGVTITRSRGVTLHELDVSKAGDGLVDINGGSTVRISGTRMHTGTPRGSLVGNWQAPWEPREQVLFEDVTFENVRVRTPKIESADVTLRRHTVIAWVHDEGIDIRGDSRVIVEGLTAIPGPKSKAPWRADAAATVEFR